MNLLSLEHIQFNYGNEKNGFPKFNLEDITLSFNKGEFVSLLGPNGCGKSTMLKIITGLLKVKKGNLLLNDKDYIFISRKNLAKKIAFVPQTFSTIFPFSVYEIIMMGRTPYLNFIGYETEKDKKAVEDAMQLVGLAHLKNHGINEVSGGEAQLAFIARAIVQEPEIVLLDEPNAHLDIRHQISIFNLIKRFNREKNLLIISVSHDLNLAGYYSDRIILMKNGKIYKDDSTEKILTSENIKNVFEIDTFVSIHPELNKLNVTIYPDLN